MDLINDSYVKAAHDLRTAYLQGGISPLRNVLDGNDSDGAYAIQAINTRYWKSQGRRIVGKKIGLTAKSVQAQLGVDQPDFGILFDDMLIANGADLLSSKTLQPKAEAEIALMLHSDVTDPDIDLDGLVQAIGAVAPAIEIVDSRIRDWKITFADTVADNGSAAFYVVADQWLPLDQVDLYSCGMVMEVNGSIASLGAGAACLGHPLNAAHWLAKTMIKLGEPLRAGEVILSGALGPMVALKPGDHVRALIGGLGSCEFNFREDR